MREFFLPFVNVRYKINMNELAHKHCMHSLIFGSHFCQTSCITQFNKVYLHFEKIMSVATSLSNCNLVLSNIV
jgi:hypothetical protein